MFQSHVGINLSETKIQLVEICYKNNSFYLENVDQSVFKDFINLNLEPEKLINILQTALNKLISKKPFNTKFVSFCLPNNFFKIVELPIEYTLTKSDLLEHLRWEISVLYPECSGIEFYIQHIEVNKTSMRNDNKAIVFALDKNMAVLLNQFCKSNNLILKFIDNAHLASNAFLHKNPGYSKNDITLSIYIDQTFSSVSALEGIYPFFFKVFNTSGSNIFYNLDKTMLNLINLGIELSAVKDILLCGQNVTDEFLSQLEMKFGLPIKKINPFERLKTEENILQNPLFISQYNSFTAAAGIAVRII